MKKRIYGLETEYRIVEKGNFELDDDNYSRLLTDNYSQIINQFLPNGARLYMDQYVPEYATPECASILDLIRYDKAGEKIVFKILKNITHVLKSNLGQPDKTSGCHENYLIGESLVKQNNEHESSINVVKLKKIILPFLVSRQILCGTGTIIKNKKGWQFSISQRARFITNTTSDSTEFKRAIINTRGYGSMAEKHQGKYERLHLILGDVNLSEISTFLKVGTTGIVLRMIEAGFLKIVPILKNSVYALHQISNDPTCKIAVRLKNGRKMRATTLQRWYLLKALKFFEDNSATDEEKLILKLWGKTLDKLKRDPMECDQEIDWVIKKRFIEWYQDKKGLALGDKRVRTVDYLYHHLDPKIGIYQKLLKKGKIKRLVSDQEIKRAITTAPQNTRAKLRGKLVKAILKCKKLIINLKYLELSWDQIEYTLKTSCYASITIFLDPFTTKDKDVNWLIKEIKRGGKKLL